MSRHLTDLQLLLVLAEMCGLFAVCALPALLETELSRAIDSVSYTHLDVYKRQARA